MKNSSKYLLALSMVAFLSACGTDGNTGENSVEDGSAQFVGATVIDDVNASTMLFVLNNIPAFTPATNAFAYKAVKITYNTVGQNGEAVIASGLLTIPTPTPEYEAYREANGDPKFSVSMICENHGTIFTDAEAPTNIEIANGLPDYDTAVLMTGVAGFASINPDYIGYGDSNDVAHPFMLKRASARSSVDMIKASMKYMEENGVALNHQLYISGYSQGGYNAMALAQSVENGAISTVTLMGVAAMAGPHDLEALANVEIDATHPMQYPAFLGYLADSYAYYNNDVNLSDLVVETNTTFYHGLFNGDNNATVIQMSIGLTTNAGYFGTYNADALLETNFITDYQNNVNSVMRQKFIENKSYSNWTPKTKLNLVHCIDDEIIPFSMSLNASQELNTTGQVTLSPIPSSYIPAPSATDPFVHGRCGPTAYGAAVQWFAAIRNGDI